jgi:uracil-DNA glycosylase
MHNGEELALLEEEIVSCRLCPRLVAWREEVAREKRASFRDETYWGRPVPGFGDPEADVVVLGLAPRGPWGQPDGPLLHRRPLRRLSVFGPASNRVRQQPRLADQG